MGVPHQHTVTYQTDIPVHRKGHMKLLVNMAAKSLYNDH